MSPGLRDSWGRAVPERYKRGRTTVRTCKCADCSAEREGDLAPWLRQAIRTRTLTAVVAAGEVGIGWGVLTNQIGATKPDHREAARGVCHEMESAGIFRSEPTGAAAGKSGRPGLRWFVA